MLAQSHIDKSVVLAQSHIDKSVVLAQSHIDKRREGTVLGAALAVCFTYW